MLLLSSLNQSAITTIIAAIIDIVFRFAFNCLPTSAWPWCHTCLVLLHIVCVSFFTQLKKKKRTTKKEIDAALNEMKFEPLH